MNIIATDIATGRAVPIEGDPVMLGNIVLMPLEPGSKLYAELDLKAHNPQWEIYPS